MPRPSANVNNSNGNLGIAAIGKFGTPAIAMAIPAAPTAGFGVAFSVKSKKDVIAAFADVANAAVVTAINTYFYKGDYGEAAEGTELFITAVVNTNQLNALAVDNVLGKSLDLANGAARLVGLVKFPAVSYTTTVANGFDADVHTGATALQLLANSWKAKVRGFRGFVQGYGFTNTAAAKDYETSTYRNVGIVVGEINDNTANALFLALGRASKSEPQRNIGRVKSGSLAIPEDATVKIGGVLVDKMSSVDLDTLHDKRYITFERNESAPGYIFNNDNMLVSKTDDYASLRYGRVIDNVDRIAYAIYYKELKDDVDVDENGRLDIAIESALETSVERAIDKDLRAQLSKLKDGTAAVECLINPDPATYATLYIQNDITNPNFNIIQNKMLYIFVRARPKGSLEYLNIYTGYVVNNN